MPFKVWVPEGLEGIEASDYQGENQTFPPSLVTQYNFGVRLSGVREMTYRRNRFTTGPGTLHAFAPGVALSAKPLSGESWRYVDVRFTEVGLARLPGTNAPDFGSLGLTGAVDPKLNNTLRERFLLSHAAITERASRLEQETRLLNWLTPLLASCTKPPDERIGREHRATTLVKDYLQAHLSENVSLADLSKLVGLSKTYLLRAFTHEVGLTPYKYQTGLRLARAETLLKQGVAPSQVALAVGLYDQSALNRLFKRHLFITPGRYQVTVRSFGS